MAKQKTGTVVIGCTPSQVCVDINAMPDFESDRMCKTVISCVKRFFDNPAVRADYEAWKAVRVQRQKQEVFYNEICYVSRISRS